jgi:hypothetical protein
MCDMIVDRMDTCKMWICVNSVIQIAYNENIEVMCVCVVEIWKFRRGYIKPIDVGEVLF